MLIDIKDLSSEVTTPMPKRPTPPRVQRSPPLIQKPKRNHLSRSIADELSRQLGDHIKLFLRTDESSTDHELRSIVEGTALIIKPPSPSVVCSYCDLEEYTANESCPVDALTQRLSSADLS